MASAGFAPQMRATTIAAHQRVGREVAGALLDLIENIEAGVMPTEHSFLQIAKGDEEELFASLRNDAQMPLQHIQQVAGPMGMQSEAYFQAQSFVQQQMSARLGDQEKNAEAIHLRPKKVALLLLLSRGSMPVTNCSLDVQQRKPTMDRVPESLEEVVNDPSVRTIEALHAARFDPPDARIALYLATTRRLGTPVSEATS